MRTLPRPAAACAHHSSSARHGSLRGADQLLLLHQLDEPLHQPRPSEARLRDVSFET